MDERLLEFRIRWLAEDGMYVATCDQFPSLSWLANTRGDALDGIEGLVRAAIDEA